MEFDYLVEGFKMPPHPKGITLVGKNVRLEPLNVKKHSADLHDSNSLDIKGENWDYLPYGPFDDLESYQSWLEEEAIKQDPTFFAIVRKLDDKAVGHAFAV